MRWSLGQFKPVTTYLEDLGSVKEKSSPSSQDEKQHVICTPKSNFGGLGTHLNIDMPYCSQIGSLHGVVKINKKHMKQRPRFTIISVVHPSAQRAQHVYGKTLIPSKTVYLDDHRTHLVKWWILYSNLLARSLPVIPNVRIGLWTPLDTS